MPQRLYRLSFKSGLHLSKGKDGNYDRTQLVLHSDTLKSALFVAALELYGEKSDNNSDGVDIGFFESFNLSSALPWIKYKGEILYFLPVPVGFFDLFKTPEGMPPAEEKRLKKKWKGIKYLETSLLAQIMQEGIEPLLSSKLTIANGNGYLRATEREDKKLLPKFAHELQQHVAVPRQVDRSKLSEEDEESWPEDSAPYTVDKLYFDKEQTGLYILAEADQVAFEKLEVALNLLSDSGLGTDKNNGAGHFTFVKCKAFLWKPEEVNAHMNISLYCPQKNEVTESKALRYKLIKRGGYIASPSQDKHQSIRKKSIYMFEEGSVFPILNNRIGKIVDLNPHDPEAENSKTPNVMHPVHRDGRAIFLPIKIQHEEHTTDNN